MWEGLRNVLADWLPWMEAKKMTDVHSQVEEARDQVVGKLREKGLANGYDELAERYRQNARKH